MSQDKKFTNTEPLFKIENTCWQYSIISSKIWINIILEKNSFVLTEIYAFRLLYEFNYFPVFAQVLRGTGREALNQHILLLKGKQSLK